MQLREAVTLIGRRRSQPNIVQIAVGGRLLTAKNNHLRAYGIEYRGMGMASGRSFERPDLSACNCAA